MEYGEDSIVGAKARRQECLRYWCCDRNCVVAAWLRGANDHLSRDWERDFGRALVKWLEISYDFGVLLVWSWPHRSGSARVFTMSLVLEKVQGGQVRQDVPAFRPGDTIRIHVRLKEAEGDKERIQPFEGVVISKRGRLSGATFTVRRVSFGIGVERIFPINSPMISSIEMVRPGKVRRARLYYLRGLKGKAARIKRVERQVGAVVAPPPRVAAPVAATEPKA